MVSSDPSIPAGCIELVLHKKNYGVVLYELELYLNRLTHLLGAGQAGDVQPTTGNCYLAVISTVFVNHIAPLLRTLPLATLRVSFVLRLRQSFPEDCARLKPELCHEPAGRV